MTPALFALVISAAGQTQSAEIEKLQSLADQVKAALAAGDLDQAMRLGAQLSWGINKQDQANQPTPQQKLYDIAQSLPPEGLQRFYGLKEAAQAAFDAGDLNAAENYAHELLADAPSYPKDWNYGNAIFFGNMLLGRVALLRDKNVALARNLLIASGKTPGSPQLNSFGPNMSLAKDLLAAGERDTVLEFFGECRSFWKQHLSKLDQWAATVKGGGDPDFGANLLY
jgi:hypothetical protein